MNFNKRTSVKFGLAVLVLAVLSWQFDLLLYLGTLVVEHTRLMAARRPIQTLIASGDTPSELREKLEYVLRARNFASAALGEPNNGSYTKYVELHRSNISWNVFAAPQLSTTPINWCFPFAGCVVYRGYFSRSKADSFATGLHAKGNDVYVSGVTAYSTLGWFDDPVLSTFINRSPTDLAGIIFHELAHQELYVPGDSAFNEGFAVTVQEEGVRRWLTAEKQPSVLEQAEESRRETDRAVGILLRAKDHLSHVFSSSLSPELQRQQKDLILRTTQDVLCGLGKTCEDSVLPRAAPGELKELNNAYLVAVATYYYYVPAFRELLKRSGFDLPKFYEAVRAVGKMPIARRHQFLDSLVPSIVASGDGLGLEANNSGHSLCESRR